ncbi:MAG: prephenate dehydrogenase/arogenate dehydrogenase family protein [Deltaproteobacteria bacterium]|nr:prephenate dehydrogenase/arogenate dehydrogenase family protein [Deltaproteobacteria bacterium]
MKTFEIGIIGGTGGIGRWFADFFKKEGYTVHVSGRTSGMGPDEMARTCGVVIVSVPINITAAVIGEIGPRMPESSLLMDFTSLKAEPVRAMLASSRSEVLGCHPLFGPDVPSIEGMNVVLCPARVKKWAGWPEDLFRKRGAHVFETTPERHDEMVSITQVLNHLDTVVMALALKETGIDPAELRKFSTPIFDTKLAIIEKVCTNNPRLYADIITENPDISNVVAIYERSLARIKALVEENDPEGLADLIRGSLT